MPELVLLGLPGCVQLQQLHLQGGDLPPQLGLLVHRGQAHVAQLRLQLLHLNNKEITLISLSLSLSLSLHVNKEITLISHSLSFHLNREITLISLSLSLSPSPFLKNSFI